LLAPPAGVDEITMPSGATVNRDLLFYLVVSSPGSDVNLAAAEQALSVLQERAVRSQEDAAEIVRLARDLNLLITHQVILTGPEHKVVSPEEFRRGHLFTEVPQSPEEDTTVMPPVVAAIVTSELGVLVGRRNDGKPPWTFIAGEQDAVQDESPQDTAIRETKEETGLRIVAGDEIGRRVHPKTGRTMIYIAATPTHGTEVFVGDEEELAEVRWVSLAEADELMQKYPMFGPVHDYLEHVLGGER